MPDARGSEAGHRMALTITARLIRSADTPHTAELTGRAAADSWRVSWLPDRLLTRAQAKAAMSIARRSARCRLTATRSCTTTFWTRADASAAELGLAGPDAVARAIEPPAEASAESAGRPGARGTASGRRHWWRS